MAWGGDRPGGVGSPRAEPVVPTLCSGWNACRSMHTVGAHSVLTQSLSSHRYDRTAVAAGVRTCSGPEGRAALLRAHAVGSPSTTSKVGLTISILLGQKRRLAAGHSSTLASPVVLEGHWDDGALSGCWAGRCRRFMGDGDSVGGICLGTDSVLFSVKSAPTWPRMGRSLGTGGSPCL